MQVLLQSYYMSFLCIYCIDLIYLFVILLVLMNRKSILNHPELAGQDGEKVNHPDDAMRLLATIIARKILIKHTEKNDTNVDKDLPDPEANQ